MPQTTPTLPFGHFSGIIRHRKLRTYANVGLLCVDEVGYLSFDDKSADLLYAVINLRYERKSVILTTNRPFKEWNQVFTNAACIVTLLDCLLHHADVTVIEGDSYRVPESEQETAARWRKKNDHRRLAVAAGFQPSIVCLFGAGAPMSICRIPLCARVLRINGWPAASMMMAYRCT
jgi:hypothetical protein